MSWESEGSENLQRFPHPKHLMVPTQLMRASTAGTGVLHFSGEVEMMQRIMHRMIRLIGDCSMEILVVRGVGSPEGGEEPATCVLAPLLLSHSPAPQRIKPAL